MRRPVVIPAVIVAAALVLGGGTVSRADADQAEPPLATSIEHSDDGSETRVLVHGIGSAQAAASAERRRFAHSDLQPAGRFVESGDTLSVTVPHGAPEMEVAIGLIGVYAGHNDGRDVGYQRIPLVEGVNTVPAPHDGMVSMVSTAPDGEATAIISGGEPVPTYVRGQSSAESFAEDLDRFVDAPFVEVVADRMFGDFQKTKTGPLIAADDLAARTANWDRVVELTNATYGLDDAAVGTSHKHPHRIHIVSPDTGNGSYANASVARILFQTGSGAAADLFRTPLQSQWALWHEIGHTYESPITTFPGTGETITNLSALAVQDGLGFGSRWDESTSAFERYFASDDRDWLSATDRVRLLAWEQLRRAFGDAFLPRYFAALRGESTITNPHGLTVDDKHALVVTVAARVANRDLAPFYDALGFPMSDTTRATIAEFPALERRIWDNVDSKDRIIEYLIPGYDPPVGTVGGSLPAVAVGERVVTAPEVTGLGTASGRGTAVAVDAVVVADAAGRGEGSLVVRLRAGDGTEDAIVVRTDAVGGDSVVARGQANRVIGALWLDRAAGELGWRSVTSYSAHTSWSGTAYLDIQLLEPDGTPVAHGTVRGEQTGRELVDVLDGRPYRDGQVLLVTHAQAALLAVYNDDDAIAVGGAPQAYRIVDGHLVPIAREDIPGWQVIRGAEGEQVVLERGADVAVEGRLSVHAQIAAITSTITMEAPAGTTFAPGQTTLPGSYRKLGEVWRSSGNLELRNGTAGADGRTMTYSLRTAGGFSMPPGSLLRWEPIVRVPTDAPAGDSVLRLSAEGNAH